MKFLSPTFLFLALAFAPLAVVHSQEIEINEIIPATSGCCSWHRGVCGCSNGRNLCCDGSLSPSCTCAGGPRPRPTATPRPRPTPTPDLRAFLPNHKLTPGDKLPVTIADLCATGYSLPELTTAQKRQVFRRYHLKQISSYAIDHLIPVEIGGSNDLKNLWPQPTRGRWRWAVKNKLN